MQRSIVLLFVLFQILFFLSGCGSADKHNQPTVASQTSPPIFDHKTSRDSVDWASLNQAGRIPEVQETDLEWPGERMGLIGPIVAYGRKDSERFIIVFDPAGIPVGSISRKAYQKEPAKLAELLAKAQLRSEIQNLSTMAYLISKQGTAGRPATARP